MDHLGIASEVAKSAHHAGSGIIAEIAGFGQSFFSQIFGKSDNYDLKHHEIREMAKADNKFSSEAYKRELGRLAKIKAVYDEYYVMKKKKEKIEIQRQKNEEEAKKLEEINELRQANNAVNMAVGTAIGKASAEIGKNYGAE